MKKVFSLSWMAVLCAAMLVLPTVAGAQEQDPDELDNPLNPTKPKPKLLIGPRFGINRNYHTGGFRTINDPTCPIFEKGSGWGYHVGLTAEFIPGPNFSIIPAIVYNSRPGSFTVDLPKAKVLLPDPAFPDDPEKAQLVDQSVTATSDITYQFVEAEVLYKQEFLHVGKSFRVSAAAGPVASFVLGGKVTQVQDLIEPVNARFINGENLPEEENGRRLIFAREEEIPGRSGFRFSLKGGLMAEIGLFNNQIIMYPGIFYDYGLTQVTTEENWNLHSFLFQVDFRRAF